MTMAIGLSCIVVVTARKIAHVCPCAPHNMHFTAHNEQKTKNISTHPGVAHSGDISTLVAMMIVKCN